MSQFRLRDLDAISMSAYFLFGPVLLATVHILDMAILNCSGVGWRFVLIYGVASPIVGYLLWTRSPRARFSVYIFLTMEIVRALVSQNHVPLAIDLALIAYLQTRRMRRIYPKLESAEVMARLRGR